MLGCDMDCGLLTCVIDLTAAPFTINHTINCKKGGLVGQRHDDARDEAGELAAMALSKSRVSY